jgi:hypothetical protein
VGRLEPHLRVREPQRRHARRRVRLIAKTVARLLGGRSVISEAVGLHHHGDAGQ